MGGDLKPAVNTLEIQGRILTFTGVLRPFFYPKLPEGNVETGPRPVGTFREMLL